MRRRAIRGGLLATALVIAVGAGTACTSGDDGTGPTRPSDATSGGPGGNASAEGGANGGGGTADGGGGAQADAGLVNACTAYDDRTAPSATRTIAWTFPLAAADRCIAVKVGQTVTWQGDFDRYRLAPSRAGDQPNPIAGFDATAPSITFARAGTFGYESPDAPALLGAVRVSP